MSRCDFSLMVQQDLLSVFFKPVMSYYSSSLLVVVFLMTNNQHTYNFGSPIGNEHFKCG